MKTIKNKYADILGLISLIMSFVIFLYAAIFFFTYKW